MLFVQTVDQSYRINWFGKVLGTNGSAMLNPEKSGLSKIIFAPAKSNRSTSLCHSLHQSVINLAAEIQRMIIFSGEENVGRMRN
jgi:hypothetical protein